MSLPTQSLQQLIEQTLPPEILLGSERPIPLLPTDPSAVNEVLTLNQVLTRPEQTFKLQEFRLSSSDPALCHRKQVYPFLLNHPGTPPPLEVRRIMASGHVFEHWIAGLIAACYPNVKRQEVIELPALRASGHLDLYFPDSRHLTEVKYVDVDELRDLPKKSHLWQVQSYLHFEPKIDSAHLIYGVRNSCELFAYPIKRNPDVGKTIEANLVMLNRHVDQGTLPDRVSSSPMQFPCSYQKTHLGGTYFVPCAYYRECWQEEPPDSLAPPDLTNTGMPPAIISQFENLIQIETSLKRAGETIKHNEAQRDTLRAQLRPYLAPKTPLNIHNHTVSVTPANGRVTYDVEGAILAGATTEEAMAPFKRVGKDSERWYINPAPEPKPLVIKEGTKKIHLSPI